MDFEVIAVKSDREKEKKKCLLLTLLFHLEHNYVRSVQLPLTEQFYWVHFCSGKIVRK